MQVEYITKNINEAQVINTIVEKYNSRRDSDHKAFITTRNLKGEYGLIGVSIPGMGINAAKSLLRLDSEILNTCNSKKNGKLIILKMRAHSS